MATFLRSDQWVTDAMGNAQSGAQVYVCSQPANTGSIPPSPLVQLYSDPLGAHPITQPVLTDGFGHAFFYVVPGTYTVTYYSPQIQQVNLEDQTIGTGNVSFPITIAEGGTNATTAAQALINLGAAARGANADITSLAALSPVASTAVTINGTSSGQTAISVTDGTHNSSWTAGGLINCQGIGSSGPITCGGLQSSATVTANALANATPGAPISVSQGGGGDVALEIVGAASVSEKSLLGFLNYPTQTTVGAAGGASAPPATPALWLQLKVNGSFFVFPLYTPS